MLVQISWFALNGPVADSINGPIYDVAPFIFFSTDLSLDKPNDKGAYVNPMYAW